MDVSEDSGFSPQIIQILIGFSIINHPFWATLIFGNTHIGIIYHESPFPMNQPGFNGMSCGGFWFPLLPGFGIVDARPAQELPVSEPKLLADYGPWPV